MSRSGFYSWRKRPPSVTATRRAALTQEVREVHRISRETYGAVRVHQALGQRGTKCDRKTVAKVMREAGIRSKTSRKFRVTTTDSNHPHPVAANFAPGDVLLRLLSLGKRSGGEERAPIGVSLLKPRRHRDF